MQPRDEIRIFRSRSGVLFAVTVLLLLGHAAVTYPVLPAKVASHFDSAGRPDGWMTRDAFATLEILLVATLGLTTGGIAAWLPHVPPSLVNLPHKERWLAPEHRPATLEWLGRSLLLMGTGTFVLILLLMDETVRVNTGEQEELGPFWVALGAYLAFTTWWTVRLVRRFAKPPPDGPVA